MDILFINEQRYTTRSTVGSNLGLLLLRKKLESDGFTVDVYQGFIGGAHAHIQTALAGGDPPAIVGFYSNYNNIRLVESSSAALKAAHPDLVILAGGPQLIGLDQTFLERSGVDIGCVGEADETLPQLLRCLIRGEGQIADIKGLFYRRQDGTFVRTPLQPLPSLDHAPWPDLRYAPELTGSGILPVLTGRGCPFGCTFCYEGTNSRHVRFHSVDSVMAEIERNIVANRGLRYVNFLDDTFTLNKDRLLAFCDRIRHLREKYDFAWMCTGHVSTLHNRPEVVRTMVEAGCLKIFFGIESGCDEILEKFHKQSTRRMIEETLIMCAEQGLNAMAGNIILGGPFETRETCQTSIDLIEDLIRKLPGQFDASYVTFIPYPNTPITTRPEQFGMTIYPDLLDCDNEDMTLTSTAAISREELQQIRVEASRRLMQTMQAVYTAGSIPDQTILDDYRLISSYGLFTRWYDYIYSRLPIDHQYWRMRASGQYVTAAELQVGQEAIPERCFELWLEIGFRNGLPFIGAHSLTDTEYELLKRVTGKLDKSEIIQAAASRLGSNPDFTAAAEAAFTRMEARRWILYAQY